MLNEELTFRDAATRYDLKIQTIFAWKRAAKITVILEEKRKNGMRVVIDGRFLGALDHYRQSEQPWDSIRVLGSESVARGVIDLSILTDYERKIITTVAEYKLKHGGHMLSHNGMADLAGLSLVQFRYWLRRLVHIGYVTLKGDQYNIFLLGESWTPPTIIN